MSRITRDTVAGRAYLQGPRGTPAHRRVAHALRLRGFPRPARRLPPRREVGAQGWCAARRVRRATPTRDIDLQASALPSDAKHVLAVVRDVASIVRDDGLVYDASTASAEPIRDNDEYPGVRVSLRCRLATAKLPFHIDIDINIGDPIWPAPQTIAVPRLLGGAITLHGYPLTMVYGEKIITAVQRGAANTRWRDFADIYPLSGEHPIPGSALQEALDVVAHHRAAHIGLLAETLAGFAALAQPRWVAWRRRQNLADRLPEQLSDVLQNVISFADPALHHELTNMYWDPTLKQWTR